MISKAQYIATITRFLGGIYLARTIDPIYFGQQGLAISVISLIWSFVMLGEEPALIREQKNIRDYVKNLLFVRISIICILAVAVCFLFFFNLFPGSDNIKYYMVLLFVAEIPAHITSIYAAYINKNMLFKRLAVITFLPTVVGVALGCYLASIGYTIWALLWFFISERIMVAILNLLLCPDLFLPKFDKKLLLEFLGFSKYVYTTSLLDRAYGQIDNITIGSVIGESSLGFYQRAYGLGGLLQTLVVGGLNTVIQPVFAKQQDKKKELGISFELASGFLFRVSMFAFIGLSLILPKLIALIYGSKWLPAAEIFWWLLPFGLLQCLRGFLRGAHQVAGSVKILTVSQIIEMLVFIVLLYPMILWKGVMGVAIVVDVVTVIGVTLMLISFKKYAEFKIRSIFANAIIIAFISATIVTLLGGIPIYSQLSDLINISITIILFSACYVTLLLTLEFSKVKLYLDLIKR